MISRSEQYNDPVVLSRKVIFPWSLYIEMVEDTMDMVTTVQDELTK